MTVNKLINSKLEIVSSDKEMKYLQGYIKMFGRVLPLEYSCPTFVDHLDTCPGTSYA